MSTTTLPDQTLRAFDGDELRARVFHEKYALRDADDESAERTPEEMWRRVAREIASAEPTADLRERWEQEFLWLLGDFRFLPGGRIMHGAGNQAKTTLLNCYVEKIADDSIEGIWNAAKHAAKTYSRGGGIGIDVSPLRPKGSRIHNAARHSTGAVSFMELFSLTTGLIGQAGRRGALMLTIADHHPDVLDFCRVKRNLTSVRYANISVRLSDTFMRAVEQDGPWTLWFEGPQTGRIEQVIRARDLWKELVEGARDWAEPGCLFWDRITGWGTSNYGGLQPISTNPCGEEPLEHGGCCDLGSINLMRFVDKPFTADAAIDHAELDRAVRAGVRFLDNVLTCNEDRHALPHQEEAAKRSRRVGLGITGLGDILAMLGLRYDSDRAIRTAGDLMRRIKETAYAYSVELAREKGPFPAFDAERHLEQPFFSIFPDHLVQGMRRHGLRNVSLLTIPPVGSGSVLAGCTNGLEPIFALSYTRRSESLSQEYHNVLHPLAAEYARLHGLDLSGLRATADPHGYLKAKLPPHFVGAHEIDPLRRVDMQAALQKHIDQSISSTVNLPHDATAETVEQVYLHAWRAGLKGVSVYREGSREGVLITEHARRDDGMATLARKVAEIGRAALPTAEPDGAGSPAEQIEAIARALAEAARRQPEQLQLIAEGPGLLKERPEKLGGFTYRIPTGLGTAFVTITEMDGEPFEVFARLGKAGSDAEADAEGLGRLCSIFLRLRGRGAGAERLQMIVEQLEGIGGSRHHGFGPNRVMSIPDAIAAALRKYLAARQPAETTAEAADIMPIGGGSNGNLCPRCLCRSLVTSEGCTTCRRCGFREC
jgi:ribonucleoside-diphosphate reductase alpha chain